MSATSFHSLNKNVDSQGPLVKSPPRKPFVVADLAVGLTEELRQLVEQIPLGQRGPVVRELLAAYLARYLSQLEHQVEGPELGGELEHQVEGPELGGELEHQVEGPELGGEWLLSLLGSFSSERIPESREELEEAFLSQLEQGDELADPGELPPELPGELPRQQPGNNLATPPADKNWPEPLTVRALDRARFLAHDAVGGPLSPEIEDAVRQRLSLWEGSELRRLAAGGQKPASARFLTRLTAALAACRVWLPIKGTVREAAKALSYEEQKAVLWRLRYEEGEERRALLAKGKRDEELFALLESERTRREWHAKKRLQRTLPAGASLSKVRTRPPTSGP